MMLGLLNLSSVNVLTLLACESGRCDFDLHFLTLKAQCCSLLRGCNGVLNRRGRCPVFLLLGREVELFDLFEARCVHVDNHRGRCRVLLTLTIHSGTVLREAHLARVNEVPSLVLLVPVRVEPLLAQVAEVVVGDVGLGPIVWHHVFLEACSSVCSLSYTRRK